MRLLKEKSSPKFFFVILAILTVFSFYVSMKYFLPIPPHFAGGMDGNFYFLLTRISLNYGTLATIDPHLPVQYPPYFFMFNAMLAKVFQISDLGKIYIAEQIGLFTFFPFLSYWLLKKSLGNFVAFAIGCTALPVIVYSAGGSYFGQKPHELISLLGIYLLINYIFQTRTNAYHKSIRVWFGILFGFFVGCYTPALIVPSVAAIFFLFYEIILGRQTFSKIIDWYFLLPAILILFPYVYKILTGVFTYHVSPTRIFFTPNEYYLSYLHLSPCNYMILLGLCLSLVSFLIIRSESNSVSMIHFTSLCILLSFLTHIFLIGVSHFGYISNEPQKYIYQISLLADILVFQLIAYYFSSRLRLIKYFTLILLGVGGWAALHVTRYTTHFLEFRSGYVSTIYYNKILGPYFSVINQVTAGTRPGTYFLGNGSFDGLAYRITSKITQFNIYNGSYSSGYMHLPERIFAFKNAVEHGSESFFRFLKLNNITYVFLDVSNNNGEALDQCIKAGKDKPNLDTYNYQFNYFFYNQHTRRQEQENVTVSLPGRFVESMIRKHYFKVITQGCYAVLLSVQ